MKKTNLTIGVLLSLCILLLTGSISGTQKKEKPQWKAAHVVFFGLDGIYL